MGSFYRVKLSEDVRNVANEIRHEGVAKVIGVHIGAPIFPPRGMSLKAL